MLSDSILLGFAMGGTFVSIIFWDEITGGVCRKQQRKKRLKALLWIRQMRKEKNATTSQRLMALTLVRGRDA